MSTTIQEILDRLQHLEKKNEDLQDQVDRLKRRLDGALEVNNLWDGS